jgi:hypothetical protein
VISGAARRIDGAGYFVSDSTSLMSTAGMNGKDVTRPSVHASTPVPAVVPPVPDAITTGSTAGNFFALTWLGDPVVE